MSSEFPEPERVTPSDETAANQPHRISPSDDTLPNGPISAWPPPRQNFRRRETIPMGLVIVLIILAVALVAGGMGFILYAATTEYGSSLHSQATAVARQTVQAQGTAEGQAQATANVFATANANIYASATIQAGVYASQTATVIGATATVTAFGDSFTQATKGTPALDDKLNDNSGNNKWDTSKGAVGSGCAFTNNIYHSIDARQGTFQPCLAESTNFSDFVYQVQMTIVNGGRGGILFRANGSKGEFYFFHTGIDGSYELDLYTSSSNAMPLVSGFSSVMTTGINKSNQIAVVASKSSLSLYLNQQFITSVTDNHFSSGQIGVAAYDSRITADVEFSNAMVWKL